MQGRRGTWAVAGAVVGALIVAAGLGSVAGDGREVEVNIASGERSIVPPLPMADADVVYDSG